MKSDSVSGFSTDYTDGLSFWIFQHEDGNHTIEIEGNGMGMRLMGVKEKECVRIAACIMRLFGGDVYQYREDCESEMGND